MNIEHGLLSNEHREKNLLTFINVNLNVFEGYKQ